MITYGADPTGNTNSLTPFNNAIAAAIKANTVLLTTIIKAKTFTITNF